MSNDNHLLHEIPRIYIYIYRNEKNPLINIERHSCIFDARQTVMKSRTHIPSLDCPKSGSDDRRRQREWSLQFNYPGGSLDHIPVEYNQKNDSFELQKVFTENMKFTTLRKYVIMFILIG